MVSCDSSPHVESTLLYSLDALFRQTVLEFGGLDCLFYTAGLPPRFAPITEIRRRGRAGATGGVWSPAPVITACSTAGF